MDPNILRIYSQQLQRATGGVRWDQLDCVAGVGDHVVADRCFRNHDQVDILGRVGGLDAGWDGGTDGFSDPNDSAWNRDAHSYFAI